MGWTRDELAERALISLNSVVRMEDDESKVSPRTETILKVRDLFEAAGIEFLSLSGRSEGIRVNPSKLNLRARLRPRLDR